MSPNSSSASTLFVKLERLRRLHPADEFVVTVQRGEDGTFGLGLSEDNEILQFHHETNAGALRVGDQVRSVGDVPLVRERLAALLQRHFDGQPTVQLHISRESSAAKPPGEVDLFAALQLRDAAGEELDEWLSELWTLRAGAVWGTFWTLPLLPGSRSAWLGVHASNIFTEPLLGCVDIALDALPSEALETRWYSLRAKKAPRGGRAIVGEVLLTTRRFQSATSVCPDRAAYLSDSDESADDDAPVDHATAPLRPIDEPSVEPRPPRGPAGAPPPRH